MEYIERYLPGTGFVEDKAAAIPVSDPLLVTGLGVYETLKVRGGVLFFPERHIARLYSSARIIGVPVPYDQKELEAHVLAFAAGVLAFAAGIPTSNFNIRLLYFGPRGDVAPELWALTNPPPFIDPSLYKTGCRVISFPGERPLPTAKTLGTVLGAVAYARARGAGAYEAVFVNCGGKITEGTRSNVGFLAGRRLITAPDDMVLSGVTRETVLETALGAGIEVRKEAVSLDRVAEFDAAFVCSTSAAIVPVAQIDDVRFRRSDRTVLDELSTAYTSFLRDYARTAPRIDHST